MNPGRKPPDGRHAGRLGFKVKDVLLPSTHLPQLHLRGWLPGLEDSGWWCPRTQRAGRIRTLAPTPCLCLAGPAGSRLHLNPPRPSPALLPPGRPPLRPQHALPPGLAATPQASNPSASAPRLGHYRSTVTETAEAQPYWEPGPGFPVLCAPPRGPYGRWPVRHAQCQVPSPVPRILHI